MFSTRLLNYFLACQEVFRQEKQFFLLYHTATTSSMNVKMARCTHYLTLVIFQTAFE